MYAILQWDTGFDAEIYNIIAYFVSKIFFPPSIVKYVMIKHPDQEVSCYISEFALLLFIWQLFLPIYLFSLFYVCLSTQSILLFLYWILVLIW